MKRKTNSYKTVFFCVVINTFISGCVQKNETSNEIELTQESIVEKEIDKVLNIQFQKGKLNGNILVLKNKKILYERSFGYSDGTKKTVLTKDYRFNIGSVYKEFPAVAIMQLQEKKLLELDDKIKKYLPYLPEWSSKITIKHLLQYSSGLPKVKWGDYFRKNISMSNEDVFRDIQKIKKLEFEPGTDYLYTNNSPILLMNIVEKITQQSFENYATKNLFIPYGLEHTLIKDQYPYTDKELMAIPFNAEFNEDTYKVSVTSVLFSSTTKDMYHWFKNLDAFNIITKKSVQFLSETVKEGDDIESPLGLGEWENDKIIEHSHQGSTANYECLIRRFKQDDFTIIILTNQRNKNVYDISDSIIKVISSNNNS
ncbi:serine hydrolase domain-containing protein [Aquimarina aquimarini]|uniref:serine hydrolase domain-containing protein n=1 Tax=Aquimarina aquimarini TaxID=1191734 RepID=UPI000D55452F|nr:serine hydrolase domain-containing protein [Aquimarina aquimarini]